MQLILYLRAIQLQILSLASGFIILIIRLMAHQPSVLIHINHNIVVFV